MYTGKQGYVTDIYLYKTEYLLEFLLHENKDYVFDSFMSVHIGVVSVCVQGVSIRGSLCLGVSVWGSLSRGDLCLGVFFPGGSLSRGLLSKGFSVQQISIRETHRCGNVWAICILLESILVSHCVLWNAVLPSNP